MKFISNKHCFLCVFFFLYCSQKIVSQRIDFVKAGEIENFDKICINAKFSKENINLGEPIFLKIIFMNVFTDTINILPISTTAIHDQAFSYILPPRFMYVQKLFDATKIITLLPGEIYEFEYELQGYEDFFHTKGSYSVVVTYRNSICKINEHSISAGIYNSKPIMLVFN